MFNNRAYINELKAKIELLEKNIESKENTVCNVLDSNKELSQHNNFLENRNIILNQVNRKLVEDVKALEKERDSYKELYKKEYENFNRAHELARKNRDRVSMLEQVLEHKELKICELNTKLCRVDGKLDKIKNMYRTLTGEELE